MKTSEIDKNQQTEEEYEYKGVWRNEIKNIKKRKVLKLKMHKQIREKIQ